MKMAEKMSLKSKIIAVISIIAALGAVAVLVIILMNSGGNNNPAPNGDESTPSTSSTAPYDTSNTGNSQIGDNGMDNTDLSALIAALPNKEALDEMHSLLSGCWTSGDLFVGFVYIDGTAGIDYGLFQTSFGARGKITDAVAVSAKETKLTILIPAVPATEMNDAQPERSETVYIDISNYADNRLNIKIENLGGGEWHTYEYGGSSVEDAFRNR